MTEALVERLLHLDPRDAGCGGTWAELESYVEAEVDGRDAEALFPNTAVHLSLCSACRLDHDGLRAVIEAA
ncbi:MAG TPA: hypothetical protein VGM33_04055 [Baekduia sp.]|jgi:hypothetical protein